MNRIGQFKRNIIRIASVLFTSLLFNFNVFAQQAMNNGKISKDQLVLSIKFKTTPQNAAEFKNVLTTLFDTISHEKNFVYADLHEAIDKPGEFLVYEVWNDNIPHFINVQMKSEYAVQFEKTLERLKVARDPAAYTSFGHWEKK